MINKKLVNYLPSTFGVYIFKRKNEILYVGKSINIKVRVLSHLKNALMDKKDFLIISLSDSVESKITENEFKALLLESYLIKKHQPKYNVICKDGKSYLYIKITIKDNFPKILLCRKEDDGKSIYFGPFSSVKVVTELINDIRHVIPFCTQKNISKHPCFYSKIGLCNPCPNKALTTVQKKEYKNNIKKVTAILNGKTELIIKNLNRQLKTLIKEEKFEEAIIIRNKIFRLERLIHFPLTNNDFFTSKIVNYSNDLNKMIKSYYPNLKRIKRIEGYDISNLGQDYATASMVVVENNIFDKKQYRKFKIKNIKNRSDSNRLNEVMTRRLKNNWPIPDLMIIDGGIPQVLEIVRLIKSLNKNIPVIGIAKNPDRLVVGVDNFPVIKPSLFSKGFNLIRSIRDESHRFAKKYHLFLRDKDFLI